MNENQKNSLRNARNFLLQFLIMTPAYFEDHTKVNEVIEVIEEIITNNNYEIK